MAQHLTREGETSRARRKVLTPDEGKLVSKSVDVREAMGMLHRAGQVDLDYWLCRNCGYPNALKFRMCRGYVDLSYSRWKNEVEHYLYPGEHDL